ncbi:MAG: YraN family protein [Candidatus Komeilibacteria bacterium]|jgi:putative endonuclease|nr:YraN family protein [Candidatus Komeilibacteria bacterium]
MLNKKSLGQYGERIALSYYQKLGYKLITQNYYSRYGELDLVLKKDNKITVVEVKTRYGPQFYWPEESISNKKINNIYITYQLLARQEKLSEFFYLDAFIIEINGSKAKIRRYQI